MLARNGAGPNPCGDKGEAGKLRAGKRRTFKPKEKNPQAIPGQSKICRECPDSRPAAKSNVTCLSVALGPEESDAYPRIATLNSQWRIVVCRNGLQWILQVRCGQKRGLSRWKSRYFFRTRQGLIRFAREYVGDIGGDALVILLRLPERIGGAL